MLVPPAHGGEEGEAAWEHTEFYLTQVRKIATVDTPPPSAVSLGQLRGAICTPA